MQVETLASKNYIVRPKKVWKAIILQNKIRSTQIKIFDQCETPISKFIEKKKGDFKAVFEAKPGWFKSVAVHIAATVPRKYGILSYEKWVIVRRRTVAA